MVRWVGGDKNEESDATYSSEKYVCEGKKERGY